MVLPPDGAKDGGRDHEQRCSPQKSQNRFRRLVVQRQGVDQLECGFGQLGRVYQSRRRQARVGRPQQREDGVKRRSNGAENTWKLKKNLGEDRRVADNFVSPLPRDELNIMSNFATSERRPLNWAHGHTALARLLNWEQTYFWN